MAASGRDEEATLGIEDQAEQRVLWDMSACIERMLVEPFDGNYHQLVADARAAVRDEDSTRNCRSGVADEHSQRAG